MLSAILDSSDYKIKIYLKDNKYYGIKYSKGIYSPIYNIQDIINTFKLGSNSVLIEKINDYEIYIDKEKDSIKGAPWGAKNATVKWKGEF